LAILAQKVHLWLKTADVVVAEAAVEAAVVVDAVEAVTNHKAIT
jgi:hypothetical protein